MGRSSPTPLFASDIGGTNPSGSKDLWSRDEDIRSSCGSVDHRDCSWDEWKTHRLGPRFPRALFGNARQIGPDKEAPIFARCLSWPVSAPRSRTQFVPFHDTAQGRHRLADRIPWGDPSWLRSSAQIHINAIRKIPLGWATKKIANFCNEVAALIAAHYQGVVIVKPPKPSDNERGYLSLSLFCLFSIPLCCSYGIPSLTKYDRANKFSWREMAEPGINARAVEGLYHHDTQ